MNNPQNQTTTTQVEVAQQLISQIPTNAEILGSSIETLPQTIDDYYETPHGMFTLYDVIHWAISRFVGEAWGNSGLLSGLYRLQQLEPRLPAPSPQDHGVYLVTAPRGQGRYRFIHWSLYSQGHFYHLTADRRGGSQFVDATAESPSTEPPSPFPVRLKVQNVIDDSTPYYQPLTDKVEATALQAYHVGGTRFSPEQIHQIASAIIGSFRSYSVLDENCQLFALWLAERTIMTLRDCSVFVGNSHQLAAWDAAGRPPANQGFHKRTTGYVLIDPRPADDSKKRPWNFWRWFGVDSWQAIRIDEHASRIAVLYREGESATGACDPEGTRGALGYMWYQFRKEFPSDRYRRIRDDFKERKWKDALFGRLDERKESYVAKELRARKGSVPMRLLLPLFRLNRWVTKEERDMWAAEAEAVLQEAKTTAED
jgi:hypothetical protein